MSEPARVQHLRKFHARCNEKCPSSVLLAYIDELKGKQSKAGESDVCPSPLNWKQRLKRWLR